MSEENNRERYSVNLFEGTPDGHLAVSTVRRRDGAFAWGVASEREGLLYFGEADTAVSAKRQALLKAIELFQAGIAKARAELEST